ncbi:hypothetical protein N7452_004166 [Penicillium brevicompactum]|uniref:Uncharacterized protein n=1 Tax=Penicillium brevicompactum TaxID=5074 RepID=A0A9W9UKN7_PENBR|nr:hypothetical protein N7452_004166 [Penicillium brevicompactum]
MLQIVPCEVILDIADWVCHQMCIFPPFLTTSKLLPGDLRAFSQVCSRVNSILVPLIYRTVTFRAPSEWALNVLDIDSFFWNHTRLQGLSYLRHTRHLNVQAPICISRFSRCANYSIFRASGLTQASCTLGTCDEVKAHRHFLDDITEQMYSVFACLKENSLRSFQWGLGTCLPAGILDKKGYLCRHQKSLESISLITDGTCPQAGGALDGLSEFSSLKMLEWEGIQQSAEVDSMRRCIRQNAAQLTDLSIGFVRYSDASELCEEIFGQQSRICHSSTLPSLSSLSMRKISFPRNFQPSPALLYGPLRALVLRDCPNQLQFLTSLTRSKGTPQLELFEFSSDNFLDGFGEDLTPVLRFLVSFKGLRHLFLRLSNFEDPSRVESVVRYHRSTLETLCYHERQLVSIDDEGVFGEYRDVSPQWIPGQWDILDPSCLTALALCTTPPVVRLFLEPLATCSTIRILHIRFSGSERLHRDIPHEISARLRTKQLRNMCQNYQIESIGQGCYPNSWSDLANIINDDSTSPVIWDMDQSDSAGKFLPVSEADEFVSFAEWAFGPTGLPNLQILALGDFSHKDRFQKQQCLIRRRCHKKERRYEDYPRSSCGHEPEFSPCFCATNAADDQIWGGPSVGARLLSACPASGVIVSPFE